MRRFMGFFLGLILGAGLTFFLYNYHVVRHKDGFIVVSKPVNSLADPYCDIREWKVTQWEQHAPLAGALIAYGRSDLVLAPASGDFLRDVMKKFGTAEKSTFGSAENEPFDSRVE